ncbi:hypothetical protein B0H13DRAFT_2349060 [Mycena leptocephala]|nr:hypothetical protein B0H13DRAFT_2349060 [Mycena leptocephala]
MATNTHEVQVDDDARVDARRKTQTGLFHIPRPWEKDAPTLNTNNIDDLVDFLEQVDTIIELGNVGNDQERKVLLTSYLPVNMRSVWRELETYSGAHSYADFRREILRLYPEIEERRYGSLEGLEELCREFGGVGHKEEGRLRHFGIRFLALVKRLQLPSALVTNREACIKYLGTLDGLFARRVRRAAEEREIARVTLQQLGIELDNERDSECTHRKDDVIGLRDLVEIAEAISRTNGTYLLNASDVDLDMGTGSKRAEIFARDSLVSESIQEDNGRQESPRVAKNDSFEVFAQERGSETSILHEDKRSEKEMSDTAAEIRRLTEFVRDSEISRRADFAELLEWCRDEFGVLWDETRALKNGLGNVFKESELILERLKESENAFDRERNRVEALFEKCFSELEAFQGELRTIQARLRHSWMGETVSKQPLNEGEAFLLNWIREETRLKSDEKDAPIRDKRAFAPLLSKKQKRALERAKNAREKEGTSRPRGCGRASARDPEPEHDEQQRNVLRNDLKS